jgi:hypothetical protein
MVVAPWTMGAVSGAGATIVTAGYRVPEVRGATNPEGPLDLADRREERVMVGNRQAAEGL